MKRRNAVLTAALALLAALVAFGTVAHFSGEAHVTNVITTSGVSIELIDLLNGESAKDEDGDGISTATLEGVMPGMDVSKVVSVKNDGAQPVWVRIDLKKTIDLVGTEEPGDPDLLILGINSDKWTAKDGYYYYNEVLQPGAETAKPLFQVVTIDPTMPNEYQNCTATIDVVAQAVQQKNNPVPEGGDVTQVAGWPASPLRPAPET